MSEHVAQESQIDPAWDREDVRTWVAALPCIAGDEEEMEVIYRGRNLLFRDDSFDQPLVVKVFPNRGAYKRLVYRWRSSKARRSFENACLLRDRGFDTPDPVAFLEERRGKTLIAGYFACALMEEAVPIRELLFDPDYHDRQAWLQELGAMVARLHLAQIFHKDLTAGNILICEDDNARKRFDLVDLNRMVITPLSPAARMTNLALLEAQGEDLDILIDSYLAFSEESPERMRRLYDRAAKRHRWRWAVKNKTRTLRHTVTGRRR